MIWPPPQTALEGSIVRLEPIAEADRSDLAAIAGEAEVWAWMNRDVAADGAAFDAWFEDRLAASGAGEEWCLVTRRAGDGEAIGSSSYLHIRPEHDGLEIGWTWLHPSAWRTGANIEAKLLMLGFAFGELGCMRVEFKTDARNERSRAALAALPATFEGIFRKHMHVPGAGVRDSAYYAIVDHEWPEVRANLERRLAGGSPPSEGLEPRLDEFFDCLERTDRDRALAVLAEIATPEVTFRSAMSADVDGRTLTGIKAVQDYFSELLDLFDLRYEARQFEAVDEQTLVLRYCFRATGRGSSVELDIPAAILIGLEGGRIANALSYRAGFDLSEALKELDAEA